MAETVQETGKKAQSGAQRLVSELGLIMGRNSASYYKTVDAFNFALACKFDDYFKRVVKGYDSDAFMRNAGYSDEIK